jgi:hypothetical protein
MFECVLVVWEDLWIEHVLRRKLWLLCILLSRQCVNLVWVHHCMVDTELEHEFQEGQRLHGTKISMIVQY